MEDRFITLALMEQVSSELEAAGFKHVAARHHIDPEWRAKYRPNRPELEPVAWTVAVTDYLLPLPQIKALIEICERNGLVVWWGCSHEDDGGRNLFLKCGNAEASCRYITPDSVT